uniref:Uncharacterized protein n=1 Tax=Periophthalmus magnuspinnatus TaxID=409849 RepID=A0A3B4APX0_9GOBI
KSTNYLYALFELQRITTHFIRSFCPLPLCALEGVDTAHPNNVLSPPANLGCVQPPLTSFSCPFWEVNNALIPRVAVWVGTICSFPSHFPLSMTADRKQIKASDKIEVVIWTAAFMYFI